jgi:hypothetical protein
MRRRSIYAFVAAIFLPPQVGNGIAADAAATASWFDYSTRVEASLAAPPAFARLPDARRSAEIEPAGRDVFDPPDAWTHEASRLIVKYQLNPLRASRVLAYLHAAMDDAMRRALASGMPDDAAVIAMHRGASATLGHFFPNESLDSLEALGVARIYRVMREREVPPVEATKGWLAGNQVIAAVIARSRDDGSEATWNAAERPKAAPHLWRATPPLFSYNPAEPLAGRWRTWTLTDGKEVAPPPPTAYGSEAFAREVEEVERVTDALTAEQKRIAEDWNLDLGTATPPGVWNRIALGAANAEGLDRRVRTRLLATLNTAMADAMIACWHAKFTWWTVRPISVIQEKRPAFKSHVLTPAFPSYPSGHATVSGAASAVLAHFIPARKDEFARMAEEAAASRLYGGIHFSSDNDKGLELGRRIGAIVLARRASQSP